MGIVILSLVLMLEIAFAAYCIRSKSYAEKIRSIVRIASLGVFAIFTFTLLIKWSFRWYAFFALLLLWAILGMLTLIRKKRDTEAYQTKKVVGKTIAICILLVIVMIPVFIFPQYESIETTGELGVASEIFTYTDKSRLETYTDTGGNRSITVQYWFPENAVGKYPLIVFSHGGMGLKTSNESLYHELATHGYVVCSIDHTYQCLFTTDAKGNRIWIDRGYIKEISAENARKDKEQSHAYYKKWMNIRTGDIDFLIDYVLSESENNSADGVYAIIDTKKIGVMGHSMGGSAALGIGRSRDDVGAVIALESPFMCDIKYVKDNAFIWDEQKYPVPLLNVYSDSAWTNLSEWPQYEKNYELLSDTGEDNFFVHISGVGHFTLTDLALTSPFLVRLLNGQRSTTSTEDCLRTINSLCLAFFDCYLKGQGRFSPNEKF